MGEQAAAKKATAKKQTRKTTSSKTAEPSLNMDEIRELAELVDSHGFTDFEFENENIRVRLSKTPAPQIVQAVQPVAAPPSIASFAAPVSSAPSPQAEARPETPHPGAKAQTEAAADEDLYKITSPIVGTFYRAPSPDKDAYVKVGDSVSPDTTICIVEAMKLMNEIQAETSGEIAKIYVENGQPVEFGQPLFGIRK